MHVLFPLFIFLDPRSVLPSKHYIVLTFVSLYLLSLDRHRYAFSPSISTYPLEHMSLGPCYSLTAAKGQSWRTCRETERSSMHGRGARSHRSYRWKVANRIEGRGVAPSSEQAQEGRENIMHGRLGREENRKHLPPVWPVRGDEVRGEVRGSPSSEGLSIRIS